jgi:hypothetical protein
MANATARLGPVADTTQIIQEEVTHSIYRTLFNRSAGEVVLCDLWNPIFDHCAQKSTPLALIVIQLNEVHLLIASFFKIYFNIILPSSLSLLVFSMQGVRPGLRSCVMFV